MKIIIKKTSISMVLLFFSVVSAYCKEPIPQVDIYLGGTIKAVKGYAWWRDEKSGEPSEGTVINIPAEINLYLPSGKKFVFFSKSTNMETNFDNVTDNSIIESVSIKPILTHNELVEKIEYVAGIFGFETYSQFIKYDEVTEKIEHLANQLGIQEDHAFISKKNYIHSELKLTKKCFPFTTTTGNSSNFGMDIEENVAVFISIRAHPWDENKCFIDASFHYDQNPAK